MKKSADPYQLLHEGTRAFAAIEAAGIRIDRDYLARTEADIGTRIAEIEDRLRATEVWAAWARRFGSGANLRSTTQLGAVLFEELELPVVKRTATGRPAVGEEDLLTLDHPFVADYLRMRKFEKLRGTYLRGIARHVTADGYLHPSFNLNIAHTYRSTCDSPNFQNIPIREKEYAAWIRRAFVPRPGNVLVEIDYSQIEVRIAACYHRDPTMLRYIATDYDMHHDMATECFRLDPAEVTSDIRAIAKGSFVFAEFYGDYYVKVAKNLQRRIAIEKPRTASGTTLGKHLRRTGLDDPARFEAHVHDVESRFWDVRFPVYRDWRVAFWRTYLKRGWFDYLTGFRIRGVYTRNEVVSYPIQGSAFHCLLWAVPRVVRWVRLRSPRSYVVGQIHDSIVADVHKPDVPDFVAAAVRIMTVDLPRAWPWIVTPLKANAEVSETNWWEKQKYKP